MKKIKITPEMVTGDTVKELKHDIKSLESVKKIFEKKGIPKVHEQATIYNLINDLLNAKKSKLKKMEEVI